MAKVQFGLRNMHVNLVDFDTSGNFEFGETKAFKGAVNASMEPQGESEAFYADDTEYFNTPAAASYNIDLEVALIPDWFLTEFLGQRMDDNGNIIESQTDTPKRFALAFEFTTDAKAVRHRLFYCIAEKPSQEGETISDKTTPKTQKLKIKAAAIPDLDLLKAKTTEESTNYDSWYTTPTLPTF